MDRLMNVLAGVSIGLFGGLILSQLDYSPLSSQMSKKQGNDSSLYGKKASYQDQAKTGQANGLTKESKTGNTD